MLPSVDSSGGEHEHRIPNTLANNKDLISCFRILGRHPFLRHAGRRFSPPPSMRGCVTILYHAGRCRASPFGREWWALGRLDRSITAMMRTALAGGKQNAGSPRVRQAGADIGICSHISSDLRRSLLHRLIYKKHRHRTFKPRSRVSC